jgi:hypothetical protein
MTTTSYDHTSYMIDHMIITFFASLYKQYSYDSRRMEEVEPVDSLKKVFYILEFNM